MKTSNIDLMKKARASLNGYWGLTIGTLFVMFLLVSLSGIIPMGILLVMGPFTLGTSFLTLNIIRKKNAEFNQLFWGFSQFGNSFILLFLRGLFIVLYFFLLVIPAIIASLAYSQAFFIMADDPTIKPMDALRKSKEMMDGYKMKLFLLRLGLSLISFLFIVITLGIGVFWTGPFFNATMAQFYLDIKGTAEEETKGDDYITDHFGSNA